MNKPLIACFTDTHFGVKNFNKEIFIQQIRFFEEQFFPYILANPTIEAVICCGDIFDNRTKIDWFILNLLKTRFFKWFADNEIPLHIITGNHDTYHKSSIEHNSLIETTKQFSYVIPHVIPNSIKVGKYNIGMLPWVVDCTNIDLPKKCDLLFCHADIVGMPMMKGITSKEGLDSSTFKAYKMVLSGHYHTNSIKDNVHMVGSPYQLTWNDFNDKKGFYVVDDNFGYELIENTINAKFIKLYYDNDIITVVGIGDSKDITKTESLDIARDNYCRIYVKKADNQLDLESYQSSLQAVSCNGHKIDMIHLAEVVEDFDSDSFDIKFEEGETTQHLIVACIEGMTFDEEIDKEKLVKLSRELYKEATDEALVGEDD